MLDHTERLPWLTEREHQTADYQHAAQQAITALLIGWRQQCEGGSLADILPPAHAPKGATFSTTPQGR